MPPNHYHPNQQNAGPGGPWWNQPNRYGHSMPGIHHKDGIKPNEPGLLSKSQTNQMIANLQYKAL